MALISTKLHGAGDYAGGLTMIVAPKLLSGEDRRVRALLRGAGAGMLLASALTDYELGIRRLIPMKANLALDAATGAMLAGAGVALRSRGAGVAVLLRLGALGGGEIAAAALTNRDPGDRPEPSEESPPDAASAVTRAGVVADALLAQEESATAAEAGRIGGLVPSANGEPAKDPVYAAGGGEIAAAALTDRAPGARPGPSGESPPDAARAVARAGVVADALLAQEESGTAAEAGRIGRLAPSATGDPAIDAAAVPDVSADRWAAMHSREEHRSRID